MVDRSWTLGDFMEKRHAEVELFVWFMRRTPTCPEIGSPAFNELLREHFLFWWELEEQGRLLGAGPMDLETADPVGFAILVCASRDEAEELARDEPFAKAGARINEVHSWQFNEGLGVPLARELSTTWARTRTDT